ncbi:hypothetical protein DS2_04735 [Catenovulum agarivorans DS-2]|uniref:Uncharacterized protein n=1 Tax=Catenovulum agarivorans DS-2 TaxID=1328313 RepID=W7QE15_9ALTE|nr:XrtA/PEP-CTERM system TPR-repeat protein PrsT [Catenovulum agarivorans]EWH11134.1 hypothetical protein DS2_04735 [Catenovulum agarivorans DS-2]
MKFNKFVPAIISAVLLTGCFEKSANEHYQQAQAHLAAQNDDTAIIEFKNAVSKAPENAQYRYALGEAYFYTGAFAQAEKELKKALELGYNRTEASNYLVQLSYYNYNFANVIKSFSDAPTPTNRYFSAIIDLQENKSNAAIEKFSELSKSPTEWQRLSKAYIALSNQDYNRALHLVNEELQAHPNKLAALALKPQILLLQQANLKAADAMAILSQQYSQHLPFKMQSAAAYINAQQIDKAEKITKKLFSQYNSHPYINFLHSQVSIANKDFINAKQLSEYAIQNRIDNSTARLIAGYSNYQLGKYEQAYEHLKALDGQLAPDHFANKLLVDLQLRLGYQTEALATLETLTTSEQADSQLLSTASLHMLRTGNRAEAESLLASAMEVSDNTSDELTRQGILMLQMENFEQGTATLEKALSLTPELEVAERGLASAYLAQDKLEKAQGIALRWQQSDTPEQKAQGWLLQSAINQQANKPELAKKALERVLEIDKNNIAALFQLGVVAHKADEFAQAYDNYTRVVQHNDQHLGALQALLTLSKQQQYQRKVTDFLRQQYDKDNSSALIAIHYAYAHALQSKFDESVAILERTRRINLSDNQQLAVIDGVLGDVYLKSNKTDKAIFYYKSSLESAANRQIEQKLLKVYELNGDFQQALSFVNDKIASDPNILGFQLLKVYYQSVLGLIVDKPILEKLHSETNINSNWLYHKTLGNIALQSKEFAKASEHFSNSFELFPSESNLFALVQATAASGQHQDVIKRLDKSKWLKNSQPLNLALANAYLATNQHKQAYDTYLYINEKFNPNYLVLNNLAYLALQQGDSSHALELAQKAYELAPNNPGVIDTLASALSANGKKMQALEYFDKALEAAPDSAEIKINKAEALMDLKFRDEARELLNSLINLTPQQQHKVNQLLN